MHTFGETGAGVPAFLAKLWRLVDDSETNNLICWSKDGRSFIIQNQAQFARELLPLNYKHNNMASFIRQLNMYGFHKITSIDNGGLKFDRDEMEFSHPFFKRNCPYLLEHIKRKIANTKTNEEKAVLKPEAVSKVLQDVKAMRGRQDSLDSRFSLMKQENEALWREIASLRQKHAKQQQIVNKLIQFLITIVQPSRNMSGVKRHMQLMINDTPENGSFRKTSESETDCGPVIHEVGEELLDEQADADSDFMDPISPYARSSAAHLGTESPSPLHMERPQSSHSLSSQNYDYSNQSAEDAANIAQAQGNGNLKNTNQRNASPNNIVGGSQSVGPALIQAVNPDGSKIVYHVTEVLDTLPNETENAETTRQANLFLDENVLTTPMVREQMARTQMLKQKNKQRRQQQTPTVSSPSISPGNQQFNPIASKTMRMSTPQQQQIQKQQQPQLQQQQQQQQQLMQTSLKDDNIAVKIEPNVDPMLFLNTYDENCALTPDPHLISPNFSEDSIQSGIGGNIPLKGSPMTTNSNTNDSNILPVPPSVNRATPTNMYNAGDFITENMPNDLFDDSSLITGNGDNSNFSDTFKLKAQQQQQKQQQQYVPSPGKGELSSFVARNDGNNFNNGQNGNKNESGNGASTSSAASKSAGNKNNEEDSSMAVTKYKNDGRGNQNTMRLSTTEEVHGHLDSVQDELESLRELLRGDGYSLDTSALMNNGQADGSTNNNGFYTLDTDFINKLEGQGEQNNQNDAPHLDFGLINKLLQNEAATGNSNAQQVLDMGVLNKLFNDSEVLGPFGLSVYSDLPNDLNEKKGSELMTYQPVYDLSDILDKSDLEDTETINIPSTSRQLPPTPGVTSSVLNTPYHD